MPLVKIDAVQGRTEDEIKTLLEAAHIAVVKAFGIPVRDRYQIYQEHKPTQIVAQDTGLGIERSDGLVIFTIFSKKRTEAMKQLLYRALAEELAAASNIKSSDVIVSIIENSPADWSFGNGEAQFLNGKL